jgi:hypothetical protein
MSTPLITDMPDQREVKAKLVEDEGPEIYCDA